MKKKALTQIAFEFLSIVFAVLLALGLNSYKQSIDLEKDAKTLKKSILLECRNNYARIDSTMYMNKDFYNYIDSLVRLNPDDITNVSFNYGFELLANSAWNIAQNNKAINALDQQFLLDAADIYHTQEFYTEFTSSFYQNMGQHITQMDEIPPYNTALSFYYSLNVMNSAAGDLQDKLKLLFDTYDNDGAGSGSESDND
ncbi:MAG: hypothetical protein RLN88_06300 [Ekhidna sp.]|uniref:hypothetical protein n=1 Tax=Ekhidna sp. TaxID=2608089 RepID=UPI0032EBC50A